MKVSKQVSEQPVYSLRHMYNRMRLCPQHLQSVSPVVPNPASWNYWAFPCFEWPFPPSQRYPMQFDRRNVLVRQAWVYDAPKPRWLIGWLLSRVEMVDSHMLKKRKQQQRQDWRLEVPWWCKCEMIHCACFAKRSFHIETWYWHESAEC